MSLYTLGEGWQEKVEQEHIGQKVWFNNGMPSWLLGMCIEDVAEFLQVFIYNFYIQFKLLLIERTHWHLIDEYIGKSGHPLFQVISDNLGLTNQQGLLDQIEAQHNRETSADLEEKKAEIQAMLGELSKKISQPTLSIYRKTAIYHFSWEGRKVSWIE